MLEKKIATKKAMPVDMTIARLVAFVQSISLATTVDNTDGSTPVMNLLHKVVEARMKMTGCHFHRILSTQTYVRRQCGKQIIVEYANNHWLDYQYILTCLPFLFHHPEHYKIEIQTVICLVFFSMSFQLTRITGY
jgi:hypothetical protein